MELTATQLVSLQPLLDGVLPEGALGAAVEYRTPHGSGYFPVAVRLAPQVLQTPELAALPAPLTLKLFQRESGTWQAVFSSPGAEPVVWELAGETVKAALAQNGFSAELLGQLADGAQTPPAAGDAPPWAE